MQAAGPFLLALYLAFFFFPRIFGCPFEREAETDRFGSRSLPAGSFFPSESPWFFSSRARSWIRTVSILLSRTFPGSLLPLSGFPAHDLDPRRRGSFFPPATSLFSLSPCSLFLFPRERSFSLIVLFLAWTAAPRCIFFPRPEPGRPVSLAVSCHGQAVLL